MDGKFICEAKLGSLQFKETVKLVTQVNRLELQTEYIEHESDIELTCLSNPNKDGSKILQHVWYNPKIDSPRMTDSSTNSTARFKVNKGVEFVVSCASYYLDDEDSKTTVKRFKFNRKAPSKFNDQNKNKIDGKKTLRRK